MGDRYDVIIIGSGPGGGSLASRLAETGKRILLLERGDYLTREPRQLGFARRCSSTASIRQGDLVRPRGTRVPSRAALLCRRQLQGLRRVALPAARGGFRRDRHDGGRLAGLAARLRGVRAVLRAGRAAVPRAWPARRGPHRAVGQRRLFRIRRCRTSRASSSCATSLRPNGLHPFPLPLGILLDEKDGKADAHSACIRCDAFDGFPCLINGKADAQVICVDPTLASASECDAADRRLCSSGWRPTRRARTSPACT